MGLSSVLYRERCRRKALADVYLPSERPVVTSKLRFPSLANTTIGKTMFVALNSDGTEGDVETQIVLPLLRDQEMLGIDLQFIRSKDHFRPIDIDKGSSKKKGYYPDFGIYIDALPVCIIEAKSPINDVAEGYREAALYAHELNKKFENGVNPCQCLIATNGVELYAGYWDSQATIKCPVGELTAGSKALAELQELVGFGSLNSLAKQTGARIRLEKFKRPFNQGEGATLINSSVGSNSFAADLSPILRRYFTSQGQTEGAEIWEKAYIASKEVTTYDKALESYLKERVSTAKSSGKKLLSPTKVRESSVEGAIRRYDAERPLEGALQLVTGAVGAGKSLFARRYKEKLQPPEIASKCHWAFLNLNDAPPKLDKLETWVCEEFVKSIQKEGAPIDLVSAEMQEKIFSANLAQRKSYYDRMNSVEDRRGDLERARDIEQWRQDPETSAKAISRYLHGDKNENIIVVFDNVDRRNAEEQLVCFQLALWFMAQTRALVILTMRDVTFELYKNEPPLDTYKSGTIFHISPPRFIDVVKRRLELSLEALSAEAPDRVEFSISSGVKIAYDGTRSANFLRLVYEEIFERPRNIAKVIEALAARNVRQSLDMFMSILTSGHMPEEELARISMGSTEARINEYTLIKILMRGDSRFFTNTSGLVANIFHCEGSWRRPSNLICTEILYLLIGWRKVKGDNGHMGYFSICSIARRLEAMGFVREDVMSACQYLVSKALVEPDTLSLTKLDETDCIKVTASGFIHMRILSERVEYLSSLLPTTAINDERFSDRIFDAMKTENQLGKLSLSRRLMLTKQFAEYLSGQRRELRKHDGYAAIPKTGADYIIGHLENAVENFSSDGSKNRAVQQDFLDTI